MSLSCQFSVMTCLAAIASSALAQDATFSRHRIGNPSDVIGQATGVGTQDGVPWATGPGYKADFTAAGVRFTPAFGERAPHNLPLSLSLRSVRRGSTLVHEAVGIEPHVVDQAVVYDRGGIAERYDPRPAGLEQSFVFDRAIGGDGDLVVRCQLDTALPPQVRADGTLGFVLPEVGGVHIGKVIGIDARGERANGSLRLDGNTLELVLPDAFVDTASFPLVLDPVIGTEFLVYSTFDSYESDVAYDLTTNRYLVVWNVRYSFTDIDIHAIRLSSTGAIVGSSLGIDTSVSTVGRPRVAGISSTDRFLVVWQHAGSPFGPWDVRCRAVNATDGVTSAIVPVAAAAANEWNPVVGGDATTTDDDAVVVWQTEVGIDACQVTVGAGVDPVPFGTIALSGSSNDDTPAISKACDATARHVITWSRDFLIGDLDIIAQLVTRNLTLLGPTIVVANNVVDDTRPAVDGDGVTYMVAWERAENASATKDIVCARLAASGTGLTVAQTALAIEAAPGEDEYGPDVAYLGSRFCVTGAVRRGLLWDDCFAWLVNPDCTTCNARILLNGLISGLGWDRDSGARIAGRWLHDNAQDDAMITFSEALAAPPFTSRIVGQRIENQGPGTAPVNAFGGCGLGGNASTSGGPFVVGNAAFEFRLAGADPAALLFLSLGFPGAGLFCGPCTVTNPVVLEFKVNVAGTAASAFAVPCDPVFVGFGLEVQWLSFNTAFSPCPLVPSLSASHRLQVTLGS